MSQKETKLEIFYMICSVLIMSFMFCAMLYSCTSTDELYKPTQEDKQAYNAVCDPVNIDTVEDLAQCTKLYRL